MTKPSPAKRDHPANEPRPTPGERRPDYARLRRFLLRGGLLAEPDPILGLPSALPWTSAIRDGTHFDAGTCRWLAGRGRFTVDGHTYHLRAIPRPRIPHASKTRLWRVPEVEKAMRMAHKAEQERFLTG